MVTFNDVQAQLICLKTKASFLGINEVRKLAFILDPNEKILVCKKGWVNKKSTFLCVTDKKIAFIDVRSRKHVMGVIPFDEVTSVFRSNGRLTQVVRINTQDTFLQFVVWHKRNAKELFAIIDRHIRYLQNTVISTRKAHSPKVARDMQSWRTLVKRMGYTSVVG